MKILATAAVAIGMGTTAMASGPVTPPYVPPVTVPVATAYDWSGASATLYVSTPTGTIEWFSAGSGGFSDTGSWEGIQGALGLGYDIQRGSMVYGAALDYTFGTMSATAATDNAFFICGTFGGCVSEVTNLVRLRARIGIARDRTLFYATAGAASGEFTGSTPLFGVHGSGRMTGWTAGLGIEHALSNRMTLRAEYLHTDLGTIDLPFGCTGCTADVAFGVFRLGATVRF